MAGKVVGIELSRDKESKSRGFAVVVFDHPVEAVQAISMFHNHQLCDRRMSVRFDKVLYEYIFLFFIDMLLTFVVYSTVKSDFLGGIYPRKFNFRSGLLFLCEGSTI